MIGRLIAAARAVEPDLTVVVSDQGFEPVSTDVNLIAPFAAAGLISFDAGGKIAGWEAQPWFMGGTAGVVLKHPDDAALVTKVTALLDQLRADPDMGISAIFDRAAIARMGGSSLCSFMIAFRPGFEARHDPRAAEQTPSTYKGMHGYLPSDPAMRLSLFVEGPGLSRRGSLGLIDMRAIAPSIARILGVPRPGAEVPAVF